MSLLSATDLAYMRSTELTAMASTGVIYSYDYDNGPFGETSNQQPIASGTCQCDIWPIPRFNREKQRDNQEISIGEYYISIPWNQDINLEDIIIIDGKSYKITFIPEDMTWLSNKRLEAKNYNLE